MKLMEQVSSDKLRGGYYTPRFLVEACFRRLASLLGSRHSLRLLEPAAGDGAFIRHMPSTMPWSRGDCQFVCVEIIEEEAQKCRARITEHGVSGRVDCDSFFSWLQNSRESFDAVVGNPPFVRYQFVPKGVRSDADLILDLGGQSFDGVSNLWIPFVLASLPRLAAGGAFALVLPSELFAIKSAGLVRQTFVQHFENLTLDIYPRDSFPEILQDVIVVSGQKAATASAREVTIVDHSGGNGRTWQHIIPASKISWTRFLLTSAEKQVFDFAAARPDIVRLGQAATLGVSIVTGANGYFTVDESTVEEFDLRRWIRPLMPRTADCPGLTFTKADHEKTVLAGRRAWLLDFSEDRPDARQFKLASRYLAIGEEQKLHTRFKCRIRDPWYRVPGIVAGSLMMTKRSHQYHRLLINKARVFTTDTVYRGHLKNGYRRRMRDIVTGFHNSATLLSAEIEGRNYGGGVLELVPSEIQRVLVPLLDVGEHLDMLDAISRQNGGQLDKNNSLVGATNEILCKANPEFVDILPVLEAARHRLRMLRFER